MESFSPMGSGFSGHSYIRATPIDSNLPFTLAVRARVTNYEDQSGGNPYGFDLSVFTGTEQFEIGISPLGIKGGLAGPGDTTPDHVFSNTIDVTQFHDYRIEGTPGGTFELFVDNVSLGTALPVATNIPSMLYFGDGTAGANATVDITNYHFEQIPPICTTPPSGIVSWWTGDTDASDRVSSNHGSLQNGASVSAGLVDNAFNFDGVDDSVFVPSDPSHQLNAFTVEFWLNPLTTFDPSVSDSPGFFSKGGFDTIDWANNDGRLEVRGPLPLRPTSTTNTWLAGTWYHVAVTFDGGEYKVYVNGLLENSLSNTYSILNNSNAITLGSVPLPPTSTFFDGLLDEMTLYNRALAASEIQAIVTASSAGKCKQPSVTTVTIDIKPGSFPNSINLGSNGNVPVAIFSTSSFDATTINPTSITLAGAQVKLKGKGTPMASFEDVNNDGLLDLVVHVNTEALQLTQNDTQAILEGQTFNGQAITGTDSVRIVQE